ncbi:site-specific DNA-methyltransferase [Afifella marina]|uniref:site-specific DNA-methyltransferase (adenine-specific) n=2 Tax=Afifella marina TaxID=1080 RepID=A0A1G5P9Z3_AFIMA|nr:site-specific DNA-methyltransferase [Afifella marina DSM 2698]MBK1629043.1 site-specific DNA-methyltransferase [Afifella marina]MBK5918019.1 site-specific DNA-methyltransferase [Afifella marina]RAI17565.1 site-specific DNA-methyltransferase [Afifella marina DSM 2698]SCZ46315.1 adenine-specific DNA-methyltransferase [Afifella marina DSM 2698]
MASLAEREGLRGKVQCIYIDPPYGIRFNSNFQWSTTSREVKDGKLEHLTREPEQVKAFRDTWRDGIHSYLTYLRDRLTVARDLLTESGSCFVQIGDENVHRVRALMDEVFGEENFVSQIPFSKTSGATSNLLGATADYIIWYSKFRDCTKYRKVVRKIDPIPNPRERYVCVETEEGEIVDLSVKQKTGEHPRPAGRVLRLRPTDSQDQTPDSATPVIHDGRAHFPPKGRHWSVTSQKMKIVVRSGYAYSVGKTLLWKFYREPNYREENNNWMDLRISGFGREKQYIVETAEAVIERCVLMTTDPGDLVLDPTCGSGTTATVAEEWGRRWITIDTSRVALALARARIMGAKYPYYLLADSREGLKKEAEVTRAAPSTRETHGDIRQGFVYERVPHITLKSIANNTEIDVIWERLQPAVEVARERLNASLKGFATPFKVGTGGRAGKAIDFAASGTVTLPSGEEAPANGFMEWEVPRQAPDGWPAEAKRALEAFWEARIARQKEIDASIAAKAEYELLYDKPYEDKKRVRVAGPFTVESLSPHRSVGVDEDSELIDSLQAAEGLRRRESMEAENYYEAILENLRKAGVQQRDRADRIAFTTLKPWPGEYISADGRYQEGEREKRAAIFVGPEYGTVQRADLVAAAREAGEAGFDVLVACAFNFDAHAGEISHLGAVPILRARMNADLHMAGDLKAGGGNLFVIFGEPDIDLEETEDGKLQVRLKGVDIFKPQTGQVVSSDAEDIACWFLDTDYNMESFFVRHAYFPAADVPYKALKNTLKGEIDEEAWESLKRTVSRPFPKPKTGRVAVKVINHLGDEVMKVLRV